MKRSLLPLFILFAALLHSQSRVDSLLLSLNTTQDDSLRAITNIRLAVEYIRIDQNTALEFIEKAERLAENVGSDSLSAVTRYRRGTILLSMGRNKEAKEHLALAQAMFYKFGGFKEQSMVLVDLGRIAKAESNNEKALRYYLEALTLTRNGEYKNGEARIHNYIGGIYQEQKQYSKAIENYDLALSLVREISFKPGISACLTNLGNVYQSLKEYDKALTYHKEALQLKTEAGDKLGASRVLNSLGVIYNLLEQFQSAENYFKQAHELAKTVNDIGHLSMIEYGLAGSAFGKGDYDKSIEMSKKALKNVDSPKNLGLALKVHGRLSKSFKAKGDLNGALEHALIANSLSDSLYNKNILSVTNDLVAKYQNEQKVKEIALLESDKELQELQLNKRVNERNGIIAFSLIVLILAAMLYNQYRTKQKANKKLKELDRLKSNFFANISHEFRTPLTLIKGPIEQLERNPEKRLSKENVKMIQRNANRVLTLVNQLLDLSKIDQGNLQLDLAEGDVFKSLRAATSSFNSHAAQCNMDYRVQIPQTVLWASFDRDKLDNIIYNLLGNAFKFSDNGALISFDVGYGKSQLQIRVSNTGKGIPKENLPHIFDRFYQVDNSVTKEREGSGIGLSLTKELVELMNGTITATSETDKETLFTVRLPITEIETVAKEDLTKVSRENYSTIQSTAPKPHFELPETDKRNLPEILLVEDNDDMRHFVRENLIREYKVTEAIDGRAGLKKALAASPDLIITDLMMPKMDGIELCKKLKTDVHTSHIPVIMLTAKAGMENKIEGLETGADDYLTKPFDAKELLVRTKNLIEQRQKLRELYGDKDVQVDPKMITVTSIDQRFLEEVLELLEKQYSEADFGVPQMQESLAMSKTQLHRKLKALTNKAPGELLRNFRLKRAAQLLSQKADSVTQIAYQVGFNNLSYFAKCFKELYGVAPSSY